MRVLSIKVPIRKTSGNLFNDPRMCNSWPFSLLSLDSSFPIIVTAVWMTFPGSHWWNSFWLTTECVQTRKSMFFFSIALIKFIFSLINPKVVTTYSPTYPVIIHQSTQQIGSSVSWLFYGDFTRNSSIWYIPWILMWKESILRRKQISLPI